MTEAVPSTLYLDQALVLLNDLTNAYNSNVIQTVDEITAKLHDAMNKYQSSVGGPLVEFDPIVDTEPPLSEKVNRFWRFLQHDISILQHQVDLSRAGALLVHTLIATEVEKAAGQNAVLGNKLKTLQLYSDAVSSNIIVFGDHFVNDQFIDHQAVPTDQEVALSPGNYITLTQQGDVTNLSQGAAITILNTSNGFPGNNQEVVLPTNATTVQTGPATVINPATNVANLTFVAENAQANDARAILDDLPATWFEYESCKVSDQDRNTALNYNFTYNIVDSVTGSRSVDWAKGPPNGVLQLDIQFDLGTPQLINSISYIPYGLTDNVNLPVKVHEISLSSDGTQWEAITPTDVWVGTDPNLQAARAADNVVTRQAVWTFKQQSARYVRASLQQPNPITRPIGHVAWVDKISNLRQPGPVPNLANLQDYYDPSNSTTADLVQSREFFVGQRWAIGVSDFTIQQLNYQPDSTMVSTPIVLGTIVDRVALDAEVDTPDGWDHTQSWASFFISPDDGKNWYGINRIRDDFLDLPEILAFNDPTPIDFRDTGVGYIDTPTAVTSLRVKIQLTRPADAPNSTPIVRSYVLKVEKRS